MPPKLVWDKEQECWTYGPMSEAQKATQYKPGQTGNAGGIDTQTRARMGLNARKATELRTIMLAALESKMTDAIVKAAVTDDDVHSNGVSSEAAQRIMSYLSPDVLRLLSDAEDRGYGKPTQPTRDDSLPKKKITEDMSPEEAAEAYRAEVESSK